LRRGSNIREQKQPDPLVQLNEHIELRGDLVVVVLRPSQPRQRGFLRRPTSSAICVARRELSADLLEARWMLIAQAQHTIPRAFLVLLLFWLTMLHISFGLLAPRNSTAVTMLLIRALSVSGAMFFILEMYQPLDGMINVSSAPLRKALELLGR
jgi:hypothetical protein